MPSLGSSYPWKSSIKREMLWDFAKAVGETKRSAFIWVWLKGGKKRCEEKCSNTDLMGRRMTWTHKQTFTAWKRNPKKGDFPNIVPSSTRHGRKKKAKKRGGAKTTEERKDIWGTRKWLPDLQR